MFLARILGSPSTDLCVTLAGQHLTKSIATLHDKALCDTITIIHKSKTYRLQKTVMKITEVFESGELDQISYIRGAINLAHAITKRSIKHAANLSKIFDHGCSNIDTAKGTTHTAEEWQEEQ